MAEDAATKSEEGKNRPGGGGAGAERAVEMRAERARARREIGVAGMVGGE